MKESLRPKNKPMDFKYKDELLNILNETLGENILGAYLYGSFVQQGLRPQSDIDVLVILALPTDETVKRKLSSALLEISTYPATSEGDRPFEVTLVVKKDISPWVHPAKKDFVFGEWLRPSFEKGIFSCAVPDPDLTLLLAQALGKNIKLMGQEAADLIPSISRKDIQKAIKESLPELLNSLKGDECNVLLTLARMVATLSTERFFSKDQAVDKILGEVPHEHWKLLLIAKDVYLGAKVDQLGEHSDELKQTVQYLINLIHSYK